MGVYCGAVGKPHGGTAPGRAVADPRRLPNRRALCSLQAPGGGGGGSLPGESDSAWLFYLPLSTLPALAYSYTSNDSVLVSRASKVHAEGFALQPEFLDQALPPPSRRLSHCTGGTCYRHSSCPLRLISHASTHAFRVVNHATLYWYAAMADGWHYLTVLICA